MPRWVLAIFDLMRVPAFVLGITESRDKRHRSFICLCFFSCETITLLIHGYSLAV